MKKAISLKQKNKGGSYCYAKVYTLVVQYCTFLSYKSVQCSMTRMYTFIIADYQIDTMPGVDFHPSFAVNTYSRFKQ